MKPNLMSSALTIKKKNLSLILKKNHSIHFTEIEIKKKKQLNIFNRKLHCSQHPLIGDSIFSMPVDYFTLPYDADSLWQ